MFSFSLLSNTSVEMLDGVFVGVGPEVVSSEKKIECARQRLFDRSCARERACVSHQLCEYA